MLSDVSWKQKPTTPTVCIVGTGISGICAGVYPKTKLNLETFTILERNRDIGGVWLQNIYPGAACDIPALLYSYSFKINPDWSKVYVGQKEIWNYLQNVAKEFGLYSHIRFNTAVKSMHWNVVKHKWVVTSLCDGVKEVEEEFDLAVTATGPLREPYKPSEFNSFKGDVMHSAEWNSAIKLDNKIVGVIGTGASSIQIVPSIAHKVKELIVYQRTPQYIMPKMLQTRTILVGKLFKRIPSIGRFARRFTLFLSNSASAATKKNSFLNSLGCALHRAFLWSTVKSLRKQLTPNYPFGTKLVHLSSNFYQTLSRSNVKLVTSPISTVNGNLITTADGSRKELDALILCTGFQTQEFFAPIQIIGENGLELLQLWKRAWPRTYYGITCNATPNMFFLLGPNTLVVGSLTWIVEMQCVFMVKMIQELMDKGASSFQVKKSVENECWQEITKAMKKSVFGYNKKRIHSYLTNSSGENILAWPNTPADYHKKVITKFNANKFKFGLISIRLQ